MALGRRNIGGGGWWHGWLLGGLRCVCAAWTARVTCMTSRPLKRMGARAAIKSKVSGLLVEGMQIAHKRHTTLILGTGAAAITVVAIGVQKSDAR